ncbi:MAG: DegV family protein [candidate division WOR-3 bacterium]
MNCKIRIAVDQTANVGEKIKNELGIVTLPIHITNLPEAIDSALQHKDYATFYRLLDQYRGKPHPSSKAGSPFEIKEILEGLINKENCDIVCFVVGENLSAIYDNTLHAARELMRHYPNRIAVIGEQAFLSLEMLAQATAEYAATGRTFDEVINFIEDKRHRAFVLGAVFDLRRLQRSGRVPIPGVVSRIIQPFLKLFHLLPIFILESEKPRMIRIVTRGKLARFVLSSIRDRIGFREPLLIKISYTGSEIPPTALQLKEIFTSQTEFLLTRPIELSPASPVIAIHVGSSLVALGVMGLGYELIPTEVLLRIFVEAQNELRVFRSVINAINVFPVRDGDTGTNLLTPLINVTADIDPNLPVTAALNQVVVRLARQGGGYSGGALSAFFLGFNSAVRETEKSKALQLKTLVVALEKGTDRCYKYFGSDAKEGTILSVMRACEQAAKKAFEELPTFSNVLTSAYIAATDELLNPRVQEVEILRQQKLVDAGGFGFTLFLWSVLKTLGLHRVPRVYERYQLVLREVKRHAVYSQKLIYRRQPAELRGYCIEGCVRGEVVEELRGAFLKLNNRLANPKMTFNVVDGATHFHIHVSEGLEDEVRRIAQRFGYVMPPRPPTRLAKRRREIIHFRIVSFFAGIKRLPGYLLTFIGNWILYALFFPIMWTRQHYRFKNLSQQVNNLRLIVNALEFSFRNENQQTIVLDQKGTVLYSSEVGGMHTLKLLEQVLPIDIARKLYEQIEQMTGINQAAAKFEYGDYKFEIIVISSAQTKGYLIRYRREDR